MHFFDTELFYRYHDSDDTDDNNTDFKERYGYAIVAATKLETLVFGDKRNANTRDGTYTMDQLKSIFECIVEHKKHL